MGCDGRACLSLHMLSKLSVSLFNQSHELSWTFSVIFVIKSASDEKYSFLTHLFAPHPHVPDRTDSSRIPWNIFLYRQRVYISDFEKHYIRHLQPFLILKKKTYFILPKIICFFTVEPTAVIHCQFLTFSTISIL